jgi:hypothetical protein
VLFTDGTDGRSLWGYVNDESGRHVLDPLSGLINDAEEEEFESLLRDVGESGVSFYVVLLSGSQRPPYFDNVPGVQEALSDHAALLESRMTALAEASGGRVIYRGDLLGAASFPSVLAETLGIGKTHSLSIEPSGEVANPEPVRLRLRQDGWEVRIR